MTQFYNPVIRVKDYEIRNAQGNRICLQSAESSIEALRLAKEQHRSARSAVLKEWPRKQS